MERAGRLMWGHYDRLNTAVYMDGNWDLSCLLPKSLNSNYDFAFSVTFVKICTTWVGDDSVSIMTA